MPVSKDIMQDLETEMGMNEPVAMPDIELKNLEQVEAKTLEYLRTAYGREKFVAFVVKEVRLILRVVADVLVEIY